MFHAFFLIITFAIFSPLINWCLRETARNAGIQVAEKPPRVQLTRQQRRERKRLEKERYKIWFEATLAAERAKKPKIDPSDKERYLRSLLW